MSLAINGTRPVLSGLNGPFRLSNKPLCPMSPSSVSYMVKGSSLMAKLLEAVNRFNGTLLNCQQLPEPNQVSNPPSIFSRVLNWELPDISGKVRDWYRSFVLKEKEPEIDYVAKLKMEAVLYSVLEANQLTPKRLLDGFYGRSGSGAPEEVRTILARETWTENDSFIHAVKKGVNELNNWWKARFERELNQSEREFFLKINSYFTPSNSNDEKTGALEEAVNLLANSLGVTDNSKSRFSAFIENLRELISLRTSNDPNGPKKIIKNSMEALLYFSEMIKVKPRINLGLVAAASASISVSILYLTYRFFQTAFLLPINPMVGLASLGLFLSEFYFLTTGFVTTSAILKVQFLTKGGAGHSWLQPIYKGLQSDPYQREAHCYHLPIVDPDPQGIFYNVYSHVMASRFYGPRGYMALVDNSRRNISRLAVAAGARGARQILLRMELLNRFLQIRGIDRISAYYFSQPLGGGFNSLLDKESMYLYVSEEIQECARQFGVPERKVKALGRSLADIFEERQRDNGEFYIRNHLTEEEIFNRARELGISQDVAVRVAGQAFRALEKMVAEARLNQIGRKIFSEVDRGTISDEANSPLASERIIRIGEKVFNLVNGWTRVDDEDKKKFIESATKILGISSDEASKLFEEIIQIAPKIHDISQVASGFESENADGDKMPQGVFKIAKTEQGYSPQGTVALAKLFNGLYHIFVTELEIDNVEFSAPRKLAQFCQKALREKYKKSRPNSEILDESVKMGQRISEEMNNEQLGNLPVMMAQALAELKPDQTPGEVLASVFNDYKNLMIKKIKQVVIDEFGYDLSVANLIISDALASFEDTFTHFGVFTEEVFQRVCRRSSEISRELAQAHTEKEKRIKLEEKIVNVLDLKTLKGKLIKRVIRIFGYSQGAFADENKAATRIEEMIDRAGNIKEESGQEFLKQALISKMGLSEKEAEIFVNLLVTSYLKSYDEFCEGARLILRAVLDKAIVPVEVESIAGNVEVFPGFEVNLDELKKMARRTVRLEYVAYQEGGKAGTTGSTFWGDKPVSVLKAVAGEIIRRMLEERMGGLRRVPAELITEADWRIINSYKRDLPPVIDPYFRDPRFVMSFLLKEVLAGRDAQTSVANYFFTAGVPLTEVNERVKNGLKELVVRLQGRVAVGRLINALGDNINLNIGEFISWNCSNLPNLTDNQINDLIYIARQIQENVQQGLWEFVGESGSRSLKVASKYAIRQENEEVKSLHEYQMVLNDFCDESYVSSSVISDLLKIEFYLRNTGEVNFEKEVTLSEIFENSSKANDFALLLAQRIVSLVNEGKNSSEIIDTLAKEFVPLIKKGLKQNLALSETPKDSADADVGEEAVLRPLIEKAVVRVKTGMFLKHFLREIVSSEIIKSPDVPAYEGHVQEALLTIRGALQPGADLKDETKKIYEMEAKSFESAGYKLAGVIEDIRIQKKLGLLEITWEKGQPVLSLPKRNLSQKEIQKLNDQVEEILHLAVFDKAPSAKQIAEEFITSTKMPVVNLTPVEMPSSSKVQTRLALQEELRGIAGFIDTIFERLLKGDVRIKIPIAQLGVDSEVTLIELAASRGAVAEIDLPSSLSKNDKQVLSEVSSGLTIKGNKLRMDLAFNEEALKEVLVKINNEDLKNSLLGMFHQVRMNLKSISAQLVEDVLLAFKEYQAQNSSLRLGFYNHNYFAEPSPVMPPWETLGGVRIEDEDFNAFPHSYLNASARIQEHPSQVHVSHRQSGRNFREQGCPAVFDSGQNSYFGFYTTQANTLAGMYASAGAPPTYSGEAWSNSSYFYTYNGKRFLCSMNFETESEDYATLRPLRNIRELGQVTSFWQRVIWVFNQPNPLRNIRELGQVASFWQRVNWVFKPSPLYTSSIDEGRVSNGSVQDNMRAALGTYFGRWARGNLGVLRNEVWRTHLGFERWWRYAALGAHWFTFANRANLAMTPLWFLLFGTQAVSMLNPMVFLPLMLATYVINMGTFLWAMSDRGYPVFKGGLLKPNMEVWGCTICDFAALGTGIKSIWDGFIRAERPPFEVSAKTFVVPQVAMPSVRNKFSYILRDISWLGTGLGALFVISTGNPLKLAATFWAFYHAVMLTAAINTMNRGNYMSFLSGSYSSVRGENMPSRLSKNKLSEISQRSGIVGHSEFGPENYDIGREFLW